MRHIGLMKWMVLLCLWALLAGTTFAQEEPEALPDGPLYQAKKQMETAQLNAGFDPLEKATLHTKYANERLQEVKAMISKGKPEFVESLVKDYEKAIGGAMEEINRAQAQGRDVSEALEAVERSTKKHTEVLTDLLGKVPEEARPAIRHSIEVSRTGRNTALDTLRKIHGGEIPAGRPEGIGIPEGIGRPEGVGRPEDIGRPEGIGRPEKSERPERLERPERPSKPEGVGRPGGVGRPDGGRSGGGRGR